MSASSFATLMRMRGRIALNTLFSLRQHSLLKVSVIILFAAGLWAGLFFLFMDGFRFMDNAGFSDFRAPLLSIIFAVFLLSLLVMLMFSNGIIAYGSLFKSEETAFLVARPVRAGHIFLYRIFDALIFSSWAFLFLAMPLIVALGITSKSPWYYYPGSIAFFAVFAMIPAAIGGIIVLLIARFLSHAPKRILLILGVVVVLPLIIWIVGILRSWQVGATEGSEAWFQGVLGHLRVSKSPFFPSYWASRGILQLAEAPATQVEKIIQFREVGFNFMLLLSNALFFSMAGVYLASWLYRDAYYRTQGMTRRRRGRARLGGYALLERCLIGMTPELRALVIKDVKTFLRDPVQWSQVLIFFGLLGVYFINMRNLQYNIGTPFWQNLISLLNLVATSLTLSTFTSRFIFPLLSLEGRKFWVLGLLPIDRRNLLYSKFWFAFAGSFFISEGLMLVSDMMLRIPLAAMALHFITVLIICSGLSGLAVGVGAIYPNLREDNPSKIVSGFGGTLNLVLSIGFVAAVVMLMAAPYHAAFMRPSSADFLRRVFIICNMLAVLLGVITVAIPMSLGIRAFRRLET